MNTADRKAALRAAAKRRRATCARAAGAEAAEAVARRFMATPDLRGELRAGRVFSGYLPIGDELDPRPLMDQLCAAGLLCTLPIVVEPAAPLLFRRWRDGESLVPGPLGTRTPAANAPELEPELLLVPLLAYDNQGWRLGYGGGYYDRTLRARRAQTPICAVGLAFAGQRVEAVPAGGSDERLDWIVTDEAVHAIR